MLYDIRREAVKLALLSGKKDKYLWKNKQKQLKFKGKNRCLRNFKA